MKKYTYIGVSLIILIFGSWAIPKIVAHFNKPTLETVGAAPQFTLTNQHNQPINQQSYNGKVFLVEFFFTRCPDICIAMNSNMLLLQKTFFGNPDFGIASITIDPQYDTVETLKEYGDNLGINHPNWHLLTADKNYILDLARQGFNLYAGENKEAPGGFEHSGLFALIDKNGMIRCRKDQHDNPIVYYDGTNSEQIQWLKKDIKLLLQE